MPNETDIKRKVASIMFTDIAGYTKLTSEDEEKAFQLIKRKRELLLPLLEKYSGKLVKETGDGTLTRYYDIKAGHISLKTPVDLPTHTYKSLLCFRVFIKL